MPRFRVVLIEPLHDGNVGAIARAMKNFGLDELVLVRPCAIGEEATKRSMHAIDVLKNAKRVFTDEEALKDVDFVAATSGVSTSNEKRFSRIAMTPKEFADKGVTVNAIAPGIVGTDMFMREGAAYGILFEARNSFLVENDFKRQRAERLKQGGVSEKQVKELEKMIEDAGIYVETAKKGVVLSGYVDASYSYNMNGGGTDGITQQILAHESGIAHRHGQRLAGHQEAGLRGGVLFSPAFRP